MFTTKGSPSGAITKEAVLSKVTEWELFNYYISHNIKLGIVFCSEIRKDSQPTCSIKKMPSGMLLYRDFATQQKLDAFGYIQAKFGCSFTEALNIISADFGLGLHLKTVVPGSMGILPKPVDPCDIDDSVVKIEVKRRLFTYSDLQYWQQFGITKETLHLFGVSSLEWYRIIRNYSPTFKTDPTKPVFCYDSYVTGKRKIYRPLHPKGYKWYSNTSEKVLWGIKQLNPSRKKELLFITSSLKDVMSLYECGYQAVCTNSESTILTRAQYKYLINEGYELMAYMNNDVPGQNFSEIYYKEYGMRYIMNPFGTPKDPSDYIKEHGKAKFIRHFKHWLEGK